MLSPLSCHEPNCSLLISALRATWLVSRRKTLQAIDSSQISSVLSLILTTCLHEGKTESLLLWQLEACAQSYRFFLHNLLQNAYFMGCLSLCVYIGDLYETF